MTTHSNSSQAIANTTQSVCLQISPKSLKKSGAFILNFNSMSQITSDNTNSESERLFPIDFLLQSPAMWQKNWALCPDDCLCDSAVLLQIL